MTLSSGHAEQYGPFIRDAISARRKAFHASIAEKATSLRQPEQPASVSVPEGPSLSERLSARIAELLASHPPTVCFRRSGVDMPTIEAIQRIVAGHFEIPHHILLSDRRDAAIVIPRQVAIFLCYELTDRSLPDIGRRFGGRDHTTILHAVRTMPQKLRGNDDLCQSYASLKSEFDPSNAATPHIRAPIARPLPAPAWTPQEYERAKRLDAQGWSHKAIAAEIGRSIWSVKSKLKRPANKRPRVLEAAE